MLSVHARSIVSRSSLNVGYWQISLQKSSKDRAFFWRIKRALSLVGRAP
jgi:hypothetical protein